MGSFSCRDGLTDRILTLNGVRQYFGSGPLAYNVETGQYQRIPNTGVEIIFNPASRKWNATIQQVLTLDHLVDTDKLYANLGRKLGAKNYWLESLGAAAIGGLVAGPIGAAAGFTAVKSAGYLTNRFRQKNRVNYTADTNGNAVYTIEGKSLGEIAKAKAKNLGRVIKYKLQKKLYALAPTRFEDPDDPLVDVPEDHERTFIISATADPTKYVIAYEANDVPKGLIIKDADRIWRGFVAAQRPRKLLDRLYDFGDWARDRISNAVGS